MPRTEPARRIDRPEPGFFKLRLVRKGWQVPVRVLRYTDGTWHVTVNGQDKPQSTDPIAAGAQSIWESGTAIDQTEYNYLIALREYALAHDPTHPAATPDKPIRVALLRPIPLDKDTKR